MQCRHCQRTIPDASRYCAYCGVIQRRRIRRPPLWVLPLLALLYLISGWLLTGYDLIPSPRALGRAIFGSAPPRNATNPVAATAVAGERTRVASAASPTSSPTVMVYPTVTVTRSPTHTPVPTETAHPTQTPVILPTDTRVPTAMPAPTFTLEASPTATATEVPVDTPTPVPTATPTPVIRQSPSPRPTLIGPPTRTLTPTPVAGARAMVAAPRPLSPDRWTQPGPLLFQWAPPSGYALGPTEGYAVFMWLQNSSARLSDWDLPAVHDACHAPLQSLFLWLNRSIAPGDYAWTVRVVDTAREDSTGHCEFISGPGEPVLISIH